MNCNIIIENTTSHTNVDAMLSFQKMLDSVAGLGDCSFIWSGVSEKKLKLVSYLTVLYYKFQYDEISRDKIRKIRHFC